ncbi:MAG: chloride channel protein [Gammaproteobacteria bacterium]|jgi:chloride channel protein, CIC family
MAKIPPRESWFKREFEAFQLKLARPDALAQLALLGILAGLLTGVVIVAFRLLAEGTLELLTGGDPEAFESLGWQTRTMLPLAAGLFLILLFRFASKGIQVLGVARVMERMAYHQGHLSLRELLLQFFGAAAAIIGGFSVGREGPHVHLGATSGSLLGQWLRLPNNSIRTLVGCGTAAGIAASFNTPLAGVIFALEVVMLEYTIASFIPVILAAASATLVSIAVFGNESAFDIPAMELASLSAIPFVILLGLAVGILAAAFIQMIRLVAGLGQRVSLPVRFALASVIAASFGVLLPEVMGIGYDSVNAALLDDIGMLLLLLLIGGKLLATSLSVGLGIPGGMIGPSLFIGAVTGALVANLFALAGVDVDVGFFALLGMGAMMGASLQAPLAALTAIMELTHSPGIIMPGMVVIIVASMTASELFRKESLFITMLKASGMEYSASPVLQALRRMGVAGTMNKSYLRTAAVVDREAAISLLQEKPSWLIIDGEKAPRALLRAADLANYLEADDASRPATVDLMEIPGRRYDIAPIHLQATLQEALDTLNNSSADALYVQRQTVPGIHRVYGILTRDMIESAYIR